MTELKKIFTASFISQTGSHFLTLSLAGYLLASTGSIVEASLVFVLTFLPAIFVANNVGTFIDRNLSNSLLIYTDLLSLMVTALCGISLYYRTSLYSLGILLALRSILGFTTRSALLKWIKIISPLADQAKNMRFYFLSYFLSTAFAGILASIVLSYGGIQSVVFLDMLTYVLSILVFTSLSPIALTNLHGKIETSSFFSVLAAVFQTKQSRSAFLMVCVSQAIFQGAYSNFVSYLPLRRFSLGINGIGYYQLAASLGIILGFVILWKFPTILKGIGSVRVTALFSITLVSLYLLVSTHQLWLSIFTFWGMNFLYECLWLNANSDYFEHMPPERAAAFQYVLSSSASFSMALVTFGYALLLQHGYLAGAM